MDVDAISLICKALPFVTEDIKWGHDLVFSIGGKMFCVVGLDQSPTSATFKVTDEQFDEVSTWPDFRPAPYVAKYKWVMVNDVTKMNKAKWEEFISQSYELVKAKLSVKIRKQLEI